MISDKEVQDLIDMLGEAVDIDEADQGVKPVSFAAESRFKKAVSRFLANFSAELSESQFRRVRNFIIERTQKR